MSDCAICQQSKAFYCIRCKNRLEGERDEARGLVCEMADELDPNLPGYPDLFWKVWETVKQWD